SGEGGIRTRGTLPYTRFPVVHLRPLGHLSRCCRSRAPPGGESGIRTRGTLAGTPDFESGTFGLSVTSPRAKMANRARAVKRRLVRERRPEDKPENVRSVGSFSRVLLGGPRVLGAGPRAVAVAHRAARGAAPARHAAAHHPRRWRVRRCRGSVG